MKFLAYSHILLFLAISIIQPFLEVSGQIIIPPEGGEHPQCIGSLVDISRLQRLSDEDDSFAFLEQRFGAQQQNDNTKQYGQVIQFMARDVHQVFSQGQYPECLGERHRIREEIEGIPIFGADFVVTTSACSDMTSLERSSLINTNTLATMDISTIKSIDGYQSTVVNVPTGYSAKQSRNEATLLLGLRYGISTDKVTELKQEIYLTEDRDYRAWIGTVLVENTPGEPRVYHVVMDDDTGDIILQCEIAGFGSFERQTNLRKRQRWLQHSDHVTETSDDATETSFCTSCAERGLTVNWHYDEVVECDVQTLYLNNTGRKSLCIGGTDSMGNARVAPGRIPQYHWNGTYNCNSRTFCDRLVPIPDCPDALSDVQFGAINYFQYLQENLGVMGGLSKDANNPIAVVGKAHYDWRFCNAFYVPGQHIVHFGDCDCELWSPLVSTDVIVHEITHGLTSESSNLLYFMQPGGLNEAYCDIMACALEFDIDDSKDQADFEVGEALGGQILRHMERPSSDGNSIDDFCMYEGAMRVHHSSGFLNRAYVSAVRSCESRCGTTSECAILMANMFMYTNLESLAMLSDFKDAAKHTCRNVEEFFAAQSPTTSCSVEQARAAAIAGFHAVGLAVNDDNCRVRVECQRRNWLVRFWESCSNIVDVLKLILDPMFGWDYS